MNWEKIEVGHFVRLRPEALQFDEDANPLKATDDRWKIVDVQQRKKVVISNGRTNHAVALRADHIANWASDPGSSNDPPTDGFFVLRMHVIMEGEDVHLEPTPLPGEPVRNYQPRRRRIGFKGAIAKRRTAEATQASRAAFERDGRVVTAADILFDALGSELKRAAHAEHVDIQLFPHGPTVLAVAFGMFAAIFWGRKNRFSLEGATLKVHIYDGPIQWPGLHSFHEGRRLITVEFLLGGDGPDTLCWVEDGEEDALTNAGLADRILELMVKSCGG